MFSSRVWPEMKKVAEDGLARNGGSRLGQSSPMSAVIEEVREKKKKKTMGVCGYFVFILVCIFFLEILRYQHVSEGHKTPIFCTDRIAAALLVIILPHQKRELCFPILSR